MNAIILSIGDELVLGQTLDTNSAWISQQLAAAGCDVIAHQTVGDCQSAIEHAIQDSAARCDYLIISGGIGPTDDDLTRQALAAVLGVELELNHEWLSRLEDFFSNLGRDMPQSNCIQAMIPRGATIVENTSGTAAGIQCTLRPGNCHCFVMPGVPKEMKLMLQRDVLPTIREFSGGATILTRTLHTFGFGESWIAEKLGNLMQRERNPLVGTTVAGGIVSVRIYARFESGQRAEDELEKTVAECRMRLGDLIFGEDEQTLPQQVARLIDTSGKQPVILTAESCTGGLLAKMLTDIPGSSSFFAGGWVTYSNEMKERQLGVAREVLARFGAVSEPVVAAMAEGARAGRTNAISLAISGVAGPSGGTPEKPVGTVCIAMSWDEAAACPSGTSGSVSRTFTFPGDREMIRDRSAKMALSMLRYHLLGKPMPF